MKLDEIKAGDTIVISQNLGSWHEWPFRFETVSRLTKTLIVTETNGVERRYKKNNGREYGEYGRDAIAISYANRALVTIEAAQERNAELAKEQEQRTLANRLSTLRCWRDLSFETLNKIAVLIESETGEEL
jgi:hypothetical protein